MSVLLKEVSMEPCADMQVGQQCNAIWIGMMHLQSDEGIVGYPCRVGRSWDADSRDQCSPGQEPSRIANETSNTMYHSWQRPVRTTCHYRWSQPCFLFASCCNTFHHKQMKTHRHHVSTIAINVPCLMCSSVLSTRSCHLVNMSHWFTCKVLLHVQTITGARNWILLCW